MKYSISSALLVALYLADSAAAAKGKTEVKACVHVAVAPDEPYTVQWKTGLADDACMKKVGTGTSMKVSKVGLTCKSLGDVEVNDDGLCWWQQSHWGVSYTIDDKPESGSTSSRWETGPTWTEVTLGNASPGTDACAQEALCKSNEVWWRNSNSAPIYIVFRPGTVAAFKGDL